MLIIDDTQREKSAKPNEFGMWGFAAERLQSFGIDPRDHAAMIEERMGARSVSARPRRMLPRVSAAVTGGELSIDYNDVTQREVLNQAALEAVNPEFIAEEVCPSHLVDMQKGTIYLDDQVEDRREIPDDAAPLAKGREAHINQTPVNFTLQLRMVEGYQGRYDAKLAPKVANVARMTAKTAKKGKLQHEIRVKRFLQTATNYNAANRRALGAGYNWNGGASADPLADMQAMMGALFGPVTHAVMSLEMWHAAQQNEQLRAILAGFMGNQGVLRTRDFALFFGIPNVIIEEQRVTLYGASALTRLYDADKLSLLSVSDDPEMRTFARNYMLRTGAGGYDTLAWFAPEVGPKGSDVVKVSWSQDIVTVDDRYGAILTGGRA